MSFMASTMLSFSPRQLFGAGEQGVWYDPADMSTMFSDAAGTTPVTAVETAVGLILDKSKGLVLGSELITNGTFASTVTGWSSQSNCTISWDAGELKGVTSSSGFTYAFQDITTVSGEWYKFTVTIRSNAGNVYVEAYNGAFSTLLATKTLTAPTTNTTVSLFFRATGTSTRIGFGPSAATTFYADNVSVSSISGNHATQSTSASRPVLSARVNLLVDTEDFTTANWNYSKQNVTITANQTTAPDGATTADAVSINTASSVRHNFRANPSTADNGSWTFSLAAKQGEVRYITISISNYNVNNWCAATFDLQAGTNTKTGNGTGGSGTTASITSLGNGWYRCTVSGTITTATGGTATIPWIALNDTGTPTYEDYGLQTFAGTNGNKLYIWGADLRVSNDGVGLPAYQRVNTSTDYDTAGFPMYLKFDGTDDSLATGSVDFSGTDKMTVWAGVRKLASATGAVAELSANVNSNNGSFAVFADGTTSSDWSVNTRGTSNNNAYFTFSAPISHLLTASIISNGSTNDAAIAVRLNGSAATKSGSSGTPSTGNYSNYPLYIGRRGGSSLPFNGRIYGLVVRGASSTTGEITDMEKWLNGRARAY